MGTDLKSRSLSRHFLAPISIVAALFLFEYHVITSTAAQFFFALSRIELSHTGQSRNIVSYLERALSWQNHNTEILTTIGDYYQRHPIGRIENTEALQLAEKSFREAIKNQPSNAKHWTNFAYVKANLNQFDHEFYHAYKTAFIYGGREYDINLMLAKIGFAYWDSMQVENRSILKKSVINLYEADKIAALDFSDRHGKLKMTCIWVLNEGKQNRRCDRALSKQKKRITHRHK